MHDAAPGTAEGRTVQHLSKGAGGRERRLRRGGQGVVFRSNSASAFAPVPATLKEQILLGTYEVVAADGTPRHGAYFGGASAADTVSYGGGISSLGGTNTLVNCRFENDLVLGPSGFSGYDDFAAFHSPFTWPWPLNSYNDFAPGPGGAGGQAEGGAISLRGGVATIVDTTFVDCTAQGGPGGAGGNWTGTPSYPLPSVLNAGGGGGIGRGGGIAASGADLRVVGSTFQNCQGLAGDGGPGGDGAGFFDSHGVSYDGATGPVGSGYGGGIRVSGGLELVDSTMSDTTASNDGDWLLQDGLTPSIMTNCTLTELNSASLSPHHVGITGGGSLELTNSIIVGGYPFRAGLSVFGDSNVIQAGSAGFPNLTNTIKADPLLAPLDDYGGSTKTFAPLPGSPAIDAGTSTGAPTLDQRGKPRVGGVDIGAFESQGFSFVPLAGSTPQTTRVRTAFGQPLTVRITANNPVEPVNGGVVGFVSIPGPGGAAANLSVASAIISNFRAGVSATANTLGGASTVSVVASGNPVASFDLTNEPIAPAEVVGVSVNWGSVGTAQLVTASDGLRLLPVGRRTDLPWINIQRIAVTLSAGATLTAANVSATGLTVANYGPVSVTGSGVNWVITLSRPIAAADRVTVTIGGPSITTFARRLDVLPGDVSDDGVVDASDLALVRNAYLDAIPNIFAEIGGNGVPSLADYNLVRSKANTKLPPLR